MTCKLSSITDQYNYISLLLDNFSEISYTEFHEKVYGIYEKVQSWPYIIMTLVRFKMVESRNCLATFWNFTHQISTKSAKRFMEYMELCIYALMYITDC